MRWTAVLLALVVIGLSGCVSRPKPSSADPLGVAPTDFSLEVTVLAAESAPPALAAHLRQSRYVLFADGSLHFGEDIGGERGADWLPPLTRVLTRRQVAEVWSLAQQLGFTDPAAAGRSAINFKLVEPPASGVTHILGFRGWGERWSFIGEWTPATAASAPDRVDRTDGPDPAITHMVRELSRLAWASDAPPAEAAIVPVRYDFGPDPYARFRQPGGATAAIGAATPAEDGK